MLVIGQDLADVHEWTRTEVETRLLMRRLSSTLGPLSASVPICARLATSLASLIVNPTLQPCLQ